MEVGAFLCYGGRSVRLLAHILVDREAEAGQETGQAANLHPV